MSRRQRFAFWFWELMRSFSQVLSVCSCLPWVLAPRTMAPDSNLTHSARVGRAAINGHQWALEVEREIDSIFGKGHCRAAAERLE